MKAKALQFGKAMGAALFILLLSVAGMKKGYAYDFVVNGIYYKITSSTVPQTVEVTYKTTSYNSYSGSVTIPSSITRNGITYSVTSIGNRAFLDCTELTSVTIPNSVTKIGWYAFKNCSKMISFSFSEAVVSIGEQSFMGTIWYNNQSNGVLYLNNCCIGYKGDEPTGPLRIQSGTRLIADCAFEYCDELTNLFIPNTVTIIGEQSFYGCTSLTGTLVIPDSVISIGMSAFGGDGDGWGACAAFTSLFRKVCSDNRSLCF